MIIAEQQLDIVYSKIRAEYERLKELETLPSARFRLAVRLPDADEINDAHLKVVLYAQRRGHVRENGPVQQTSPLQLESPIPVPWIEQNTLSQQHGALQFPWTEEGRLVLSQEEVRHYQPFDTVFLDGSEYNIRIEFLVTQITGEGEREAIIGYGVTALSEVLSADEERVEIDLIDEAHNRIPDAYAELAVNWVKFFHDKMVLEVHVAIEKRSGWPFSSARPFFVLYKWDPRFRHWSPIYRSEVLTKSISFPDSKASKGSMIFELAEIMVRNTLDGEDTRQLRLEFFHYKTKGNPKVLGFFETSLRHLRLSRKQGNLNLELNTFAEGELIGELRMLKSELSASRSYFCLEATFGGDVDRNLVFFDISLTDVNARKGWRRQRKPYYTIARYSDTKRWEKVYHSETVSRVAGRLHRYRVAKLTKRRLNGDKTTRPISIMLFQSLDGRRIGIGHIETSVARLLGAEFGAIFALEGAGVGKGYVRVVRMEETENCVYFELHCVLGGSIERNILTEEVVEEVSTG